MPAVSVFYLTRIGRENTIESGNGHACHAGGWSIASARFRAL
jgi:hypothetical protein